MNFALVCALCVASQPASPAASPVDSGRFHLLEERLSLRQLEPAPPPAPPPVSLSLVPAPLSNAGSGDGEGGSDHMGGTMWIVMGAMMAVMMVGAGVYAMRHEAPSMRLHTAAALPSPARLAVPEGGANGGGG